MDNGGLAAGRRFWRLGRILHVPPGNYMASVYAHTRHWRPEKVLYRLIGAQPDDRQRWMKYATSVLAFSAISVLFLYGLLLVQTRLPEPWGHKGYDACAGVQHRNLVRHQHQLAELPRRNHTRTRRVLAGLGVQAFASCAVGMCVAVALIRGLAQCESEAIGNFWVDLVRTVVHPCSAVDRRHADLARARGGQQFAWRTAYYDHFRRKSEDFLAAPWPRGNQPS